MPKGKKGQKSVSKVATWNIDYVTHDMIITHHSFDSTELFIGNNNLLNFSYFFMIAFSAGLFI